MKLGNKNVVKNTTTEATYLLMDSKDEDGGMANHEKRMKMIGRGRREGGRLSAAEVLGSMEVERASRRKKERYTSTFCFVFNLVNPRITNSRCRRIDGVNAIYIYQKNRLFQ